jgi:hypothetical protein
MLQILAVVAGLALIYLLFTTVLGGGDEGDLAAPTGTTGGTPSGSPTVSPSPTPRETLPPVVMAGSRDPFSIPPELSPSPAEGGSVGPTGPTGGTTSPTSPPTSPTSPPTSPTSPPTSPTSPPTSPTSPPTSPPPPPPSDEIVIGGHRVQLVEVQGARDRLQVEVDGRLYTVEEGALFDEIFKLVRIDGDCARFLFGDQSFELCEP